MNKFKKKRTNYVMERKDVVEEEEKKYEEDIAQCSICNEQLLNFEDNPFG